jgi:dipeptidyl aminopeptidase/acylaminoacyl peptidase
MYPLGHKRGKRYPLVMMVHGGPEWQALDGWISRYLWPGQVLAAQGYAVLAPNYRGSAGRGAKFAMADHKDLGGRELLDNVDAIAHLDQIGLVDPKRVGMMGGSYGGYMSALAATKASAHFAAAINFAGIGNWMSFTGTSDIPYENSLVHWDLWCYDAPEACRKGSPITFINQAKTPLLLLHGKEDKRVPISQAWELHTAFRVKKIPTEFVIYPREGHGLRERAHQRDAVDRSLAWFKQYLKAK